MAHSETIATRSGANAIRSFPRTNALFGLGAPASCRAAYHGLEALASGSTRASGRNDYRGSAATHRPRKSHGDGLKQFSSISTRYEESESTQLEIVHRGRLRISHRRLVDEWRGP